MPRGLGGESGFGNGFAVTALGQQTDKNQRSLVAFPRAPHACIAYASAPSVLPARSASDGIPRKTLSLALRAGIGSLREMVACATQS
jgi:hypothetical protein